MSNKQIIHLSCHTLKLQPAVANATSQIVKANYGVNTDVIVTILDH